jgi:hypothetical protein
MKWLEVPVEQAVPKALKMLDADAEVLAFGKYGVVLRDSVATLSIQTDGHRTAKYCCVTFHEDHS